GILRHPIPMGVVVIWGLTRKISWGKNFWGDWREKTAFPEAIRFPTNCVVLPPPATAAMTDDTLLPFDLPSVCRKKITVDFNGGTQSSNAGLLLLREKERTLGVCWRLASTMTDRRDPNRIRHEMFEMVMARVSAIACGYEDANDLDRLRHDPLMKLAVGRCPQSGGALASQSTICRLENAPR